jgi:hypothetical protein
LRWIWWHILDDNPDPPGAEALAAAAAREDREYPECHGSRYRRQFPNWLEERLASDAEYHSYLAWYELEAALEGRRGLPSDRLGWL